MFKIENIIRSATRKAGDKLNILIFQEGNEDYIERLCLTGHNFYCISDYCTVFPWRRKEKPKNLHIYKEFIGSGVVSFDFIIVFNRTRMYEDAIKVSSVGHIPIIVVDTIGAMTKVPMPFFTTAQINNEAAMYARNGIVNIATTEIVEESWYNVNTSFAYTIPIGGNEQVLSGEKILIDPTLPKEYLESLPINVLDGSKYTTKPYNVKCYLHLWQNITPLMIDCLCSDIPVITFKSLEFQELIDNNSIHIIDNLLDFEYVNLNGIGTKYDKEKNDMSNFIKEWNNIFNNFISGYYTR